jgi:DNA repair protein RadC
MTNQIADAANALQITLHDHLIIGKSQEFSFKAQGFL